MTPTQWNALVSSLQRATVDEILAAFTAVGRDGQFGQSKVDEVLRGLMRKSLEAER